MCDCCDCCCRRRNQACRGRPSSGLVDEDALEGYATWQRVVIGIAAMVTMLSVMLFFARMTELMFLGPLAGESHIPTQWIFLGSIIVAALVWSLGPLQAEPNRMFKGRKG